MTYEIFSSDAEALSKSLLHKPVPPVQAPQCKFNDFERLTSLKLEHSDFKYEYGVMNAEEMVLSKLTSGASEGNGKQWFYIHHFVLLSVKSDGKFKITAQVGNLGRHNLVLSDDLKTPEILGHLKQDGFMIFREPVITQLQFISDNADAEIDCLKPLTMQTLVKSNDWTPGGFERFNGIFQRFVLFPHTFYILHF